MTPARPSGFYTARKITRTQSRHSQHYTLHVYATIGRMICWDLSRMNASNGEIQRVVGLGLVVP